LENVAMPLTALTVVVPPSVALPGLAPRAIVMLALEPVTVVPLASCTATCTAGEIALSMRAFVGWAVNASFAAGPAFTSWVRGRLTELPARMPDPPPLKHALTEWVPEDKVEMARVACRTVEPLPVKFAKATVPSVVPPLQLPFAPSVKSTD
jgi:hypothetical protein